ncbi:MAG: NUDIX hydrolase [Candidatus Micrarchaeaceae archaeon]
MKVLIKSKMFTVESGQFSKEGKTVKGFSIKTRDVVVILPILNGGSIIMERQYRFPMKKYIYELPAGHIEKGEKPFDAAMCELEEETGYAAGRMRLMFKAYSSPGLLTEKLYVYSAENLKKTEQKLEYGEFIHLKKISIKAALSMIRSGKITDLKTIAGIIYYVRMMR